MWAPTCWQIPSHSHQNPEVLNLYPAILAQTKSTSENCLMTLKQTRYVHARISSVPEMQTPNPVLALSDLILPRFPISHCCIPSHGTQQEPDPGGAGFCGNFKITLWMILELHVFLPSKGPGPLSRRDNGQS